MAKPILPRQDPAESQMIAPASEVPILLSNAGSWYGYSSGTSAATAWVSSVIALAIQNEPHLARSGDRNNIEELKQRIAENSIPKEGQMGHDDRFGYGILFPGLIGGGRQQPRSGHILWLGGWPRSDHHHKSGPDSSTTDLNPGLPASRTIRSSR